MMTADNGVVTDWQSYLGNLAMVRGDFQAALDEHSRARELARELGEGHPDHLHALLSIGDGHAAHSASVEPESALAQNR